MSDIIRTVCPIRSGSVVTTLDGKEYKIKDSNESKDQFIDNEQALFDNLASLDAQNRLLINHNFNECPACCQDSLIDPSLDEQIEMNNEPNEPNEPCIEEQEPDDCVCGQPDKQYVPRSMTEALLMSGYEFHDDKIDNYGNLIKEYARSVADFTESELQEMTPDEIEDFLTMSGDIEKRFLH